MLGFPAPSAWVPDHFLSRVPVFAHSTSRFDVHLAIYFFGFFASRAMQRMNSHLMAATLNITSTVSAISSVATIPSKRAQDEAGKILEITA